MALNIEVGIMVNIEEKSLLTISISYGVSIESDIQLSFCEMKTFMTSF